MSSRVRNTLFVVCSAALFVWNWSAIRSLIAYALDLDNTNASQVVLIPFISGALIFMGRKKIFGHVEFSVLPGTFLILAGVGLLIASRTWGGQFELGDQLALATSAILVFWLGEFLFFYGTKSFRAALFPLLVLGFCIPVPSVIMVPSIAFLQRGSAEIAFVLLKLSGTPIFREGFIFTMPGLKIEVAPECSGIRSCISMLILIILTGHLLLTTTWRRIALVLVAIPIMVFKNAVRIATLSLLSIHIDKSIIESRLHREGGIPFFLLALVLIYPILTAFMKAERRATGGPSVLREVNP